MEYVEGSTLRSRLTQPLSLEEFLPLAIQCAEALVAAHEKGVVHRDIKPENIMLTAKGQVKILDFGVAKRLVRPADADATASTASQPGALSGTPAYMAPEVLLEKPSDERADIFSLGVVFYEMLTAQHPFRADSFLATSDRIRHEVPPPLGQLNPQVPEGLERLVARMLAKDSVNRHGNASELVADLRALERPEARAGLVLAALRAWVRRRKVVTLAVLGAVLLLLALLIVPLIPPPPTPVEVPQKMHLAVLPFVVVGGTAETAAFSNGLTETLNARLTQLTERHSLQVVPAAEVRAEDVRTLEQARREFGVNLVLEGSLQQAAGMVRVTYALVDASTRRQLRAESITAAADDPFAVEDRVVASVLENLEIELQPRERSVLAAHGTREPAAYDYYLRGRGYLQDYHKPENIESAIEVFNRALERDSQYALAYAGVGEAYWHRYQQTQESKWVAEALGACDRAVALDAGLSNGHACLGVVYNGTGRYEQAVEQFRRALDLEPTSDDAFRGLASAYESLGRTKEAEETYRRAISLRPRYWAGHSWLGAFYFRQGRHPEAAEMFAQVVTLVPDSFRGYSNLGAIYFAEGRYAEAIPMFERSVSIRPTAIAYSNLATAYFLLRRFSEAAQMGEEAVRLDERDYQVWGNLGDAYYWAPGKRTQAAGAYRKALALAEERLRVNPRDATVLGYAAYFHAMLNERGKALGRCRQALAVAPSDPELRFNIALVHNQFGEVNQTLEWLRKALAAGYSRATVRDTPILDNLRANPRFQELLRER